MTTEELFAQMEAQAATEKEYCVIDPITREISVPEVYQKIGVVSDEKTNRIYFQCPRIVGDNVDLTKYGIRVNYQNANGQTKAYPVDDVAVSGDNITFSWLLDRPVTTYKGTINFVVCAIKTSGDEITNEWNTTLAKAEVLEGLEPDIAITEDEESIVELLIAQCTQKLTEMNMAIQNSENATNDAKTATQEAVNATEDARSVIEQITKDSYLHTALQSFVDAVTASPTAYGNAIPKQIEGYIRQEKTTGAQLFDVDSTITANQATKAILNDGRDLQVTGKKVDSSNWGYAYYTFPAEKVSGKTLYVYVEYNSGLGCEFNIKDAENRWTYPLVSSGTWMTISVPSNVRQCSILFYPNRTTETEVTGVYKNIKVGFTQFEEWEPYTGGESSPSPDYPQVIHGVGDMGFFDGELLNGYFKRTDGLFYNNGTTVTNANKIPCKVGDVVELSYPTSAELIIIFYEEDDTVLSTNGYADNAISVKQTAPAGTAYCRIDVTSRVSNDNAQTNGKHITVTINGMYAICVKSTGPNIFNKNGFTAGSAARATVYDETVQITSMEGSGDAPGVFFYLGPITKFLGKRIYIKADKMESTHSAEGKASCRMVIRSVKGGSNVQSYGIYQNTKAGTWMLSAEIPADLDLSTVTELCLQMYIGDGTTQVAVGKTAIFENVMVCWEKTEEYHPYQSSVTYIPVDYPLFEDDKIVQRNGEYKLLRKWGFKTYDGSDDENWRFSAGADTTNNFAYMVVAVTDALSVPDPVSNIYSNRVIGVASPKNAYEFSGYITLHQFVIFTNKYESETAFKTWLKSNPITLAYQLETPTEEPLSPEAVKALNSIMAADEETELTIVGVPADVEISNQFLLPRNEDGALNTTAYCTAEKNKIVLNELVAKNLDSRINKLEIDNESLAEQTIVVE